MFASLFASALAYCFKKKMAWLAGLEGQGTDTKDCLDWISSWVMDDGKHLARTVNMSATADPTSRSCIQLAFFGIESGRRLGSKHQVV
jgi:hypothetical protein